MNYIIKLVPSSSSTDRHDPFFPLQNPSAKLTSSSTTNTNTRENIQISLKPTLGYALWYVYIYVFMCVTQGVVWDAIYFQNKVIFKEHITHNREEVDQDQAQDSCQHDGTAISSDTLDDVQQSLLPVHQVKQLHTHIQMVM